MDERRVWVPTAGPLPPSTDAEMAAAERVYQRLRDVSLRSGIGYARNVITAAGPPSYLEAVLTLSMSLRKVADDPHFCDDLISLTSVAIVECLRYQRGDGLTEGSP